LFDRFLLFAYRRGLHAGSVEPTEPPTNIVTKAPSRSRISRLPVLRHRGLGLSWWPTYPKVAISAHDARKGTVACVLWPAGVSFTTLQVPHTVSRTRRSVDIQKFTGAFVGANPASLGPASYGYDLHVYLDAPFKSSWVKTCQRTRPVW